MCAQAYQTISSRDHFIAEIRSQFGDQLKALETRTETQQTILAELQDYYRYICVIQVLATCIEGRDDGKLRRRAELEAEYGRNLEKLAKQTLSKHKAEKAK